jgi:hypothetical protein
MYEDGSFKSINEKLFKSEIEANDDNREIAETIQDTELSNDLMTLLERFRNELSDVGQELASFYAEYQDKEDLDKITKPEKISIFLNIADQITSALEKADFDGFSKAVIESIKKLYDDIQEQNKAIAGNIMELMNLVASRSDYDLSEAEDDEQSQLEQQQNTQYTQFTKRIRSGEIISRVSQILSLLGSKLLNYQQNVLNPPTEVVGSGRKQTGFLNLGPYQTKEKLIV